MWFISLVHDLPVPLDLWDELKALPAEKQCPEAWRLLRRWRTGAITACVGFVLVAFTLWFMFPLGIFPSVICMIGGLIVADESGRQAFEAQAVFSDTLPRTTPRRLRRLAEKQRRKAK